MYTYIYILRSLQICIYIYFSDSSVKWKYWGNYVSLSLLRGIHISKNVTQAIHAYVATQVIVFVYVRASFVLCNFIHFILLQMKFNIVYNNK